MAQGDVPGSILKSGELYFRKGAKKVISRTLTKSNSIAQSDNLSTGNPQDWKRVYGTLSKDCRLVLFEYDKDVSGKASVSRKPLTKVVASIDIAVLEDHAIQTAHESVTGRRYSFAFATKERTIYLSANTGLDRDEWLLLCNRQLIEKNSDPKQMYLSLSISPFCCDGVLIRTHLDTGAPQCLCPWR